MKLRNELSYASIRWRVEFRRHCSLKVARNIRFNTITETTEYLRKYSTTAGGLKIARYIRFNTNHQLRKQLPKLLNIFKNIEQQLGVSKFQGIFDLTQLPKLSNIKQNIKQQLEPLKK